MERQTSKRTPRAKNFTSDETEILVKAAEERRNVLFGPLRGPALTQFHRDKAWEQVLNAVNAVAPTHRSVEDLKRKFKDLKNRTKVKASNFKQAAKNTDGGDIDPNPLSAVEEIILSFIGAEGIKGGIEIVPEDIVAAPNVNMVYGEELDPLSNIKIEESYMTYEDDLPNISASSPINGDSKVKTRSGPSTENKKKSLEILTERLMERQNSKDARDEELHNDRRKILKRQLEILNDQAAIDMEIKKKELELKTKQLEAQNLEIEYKKKLLEKM